MGCSILDSMYVDSRAVAAVEFSVDRGLGEQGAMWSFNHIMGLTLETPWHHGASGMVLGLGLGSGVLQVCFST